VVSINLTGAASGTLEAARSAADRSNAPGRIHVINSFNASLGQGLLTVFAAECAVAGLPVDATIAAVESLIPQTHTYAVLSNLDYAVRGGRIPSWVKTAAEWTRLTPVIRITAAGKIAQSGCIVGKSNLIAKFAQHIARRVRSDRPIVVAVGHAMSAESAAELGRLLKQKVPNIRRLSVAELGTALGVHGGPGTLVIATQPYLMPVDFAG
jgi:DegV family protein with EDD domain